MHVWIIWREVFQSVQSQQATFIKKSLSVFYFVIVPRCCVVVVNKHESNTNFPMLSKRDIMCLCHERADHPTGKTKQEKTNFIN